jgi:predicted nucleic acid-binding protein
MEYAPAPARRRLSIGESEPTMVQIITPGQVTDAYLLALAVANEGQLATFDRRLSTKAVHGGRAALHVIAGGN